MLKAELHEVKEINGRRKKRECGKRKILKDTPVISSEELVKALKKAEISTSGREKGNQENKGEAQSETG